MQCLQVQEWCHEWYCWCHRFSEQHTIKWSWVGPTIWCRVLLLRLIQPVLEDGICCLRDAAWKLPMLTFIFTACFPDFTLCPQLSWSSWRRLEIYWWLASMYQVPLWIWLCGKSAMLPLHWAVERAVKPSTEYNPSCSLFLPSIAKVPSISINPPSAVTPPVLLSLMFYCHL